MPVTRRMLLQLMASTLLLRDRPACAAADPLIFSVGNVPAPQQIHKVVSAGPPADLLLLATAPEKLMGFSSVDVASSAQGLLPETVRKLPRYGRLTGRGNTLSLEQLIALKPDLIIDSGNTDETWTSMARRINAQTQIPWLLVSGKLHQAAEQLQATGHILGTAARTTQQAELARYFISEARAFSRSRAASISFYAARGAKGLETGLQGSLHTEAAELLGLRNVARTPGRSGLVQVSLEDLLQWQPDIILVQQAATLQNLTRDPLWQGVEAVARGRILFLSGLPFGWLDAPPGINRLLGLRRLHAWLDSAVNRTFAHDMQRYAALFWHTTLTDDRYNQIMTAR